MQRYLCEPDAVLNCCFFTSVCCVYEYEEEYKVLLALRPDDKQLQTWSRGVVLEDGYKTAPAQIWFQFLKVRIGTLRLGNLKPRQWRYLTTQEVADLKKLVNHK